jgi:hypothetical protein
VSAPAPGPSPTGSDPAPLTRRQLWALGAGAGRELRHGLWMVKREMATWEARAAAIEDHTARAEVLAALAGGRPLVDGAAFFWTLTPRRHDEVVRLLVALQTLLNLMDHALERDADETEGRPGTWTRLLGQALDLTRPPPSPSEVTMFPEDQGLVHALVATCRASCAALPGYERAHALVVREARRAVSFEIEHDLRADRRLSDMQAYAARHFPRVSELTSWELVGGASSLMTAMAVLVLAADGAPVEHLAAAADAYVWVGSVGALLDSYGDQLADARTGAHNWHAYYPEWSVAIERTSVLLQQTLRKVGALPHGERHIVLVACMAALWLSSDEARSKALRPTTDRILEGAGATTRLLVPILRLWRIAYGRTAS